MFILKCLHSNCRRSVQRFDDQSLVFSFVNLLLSQMSVEELREEACDCLFEIINKGMDPVDKTKLVESLCQVLQSAGFFNVEQVRPHLSQLRKRDRS